MEQVISLDNFRLSRQQPETNTPKKRNSKFMYDEVCVAILRGLTVRRSREGRDYLLVSMDLLTDSKNIYKQDVGSFFCWADDYVELARKLQSTVARFLGDSLDLISINRLDPNLMCSIASEILKGRALTRVVREGKKSYQKVYILEPDTTYCPSDEVLERVNSLKNHY